MKKEYSALIAALLCLCVLFSATAPASAALAGSLTLNWGKEENNAVTLRVEGLDGTRNVYAAQLDITLSGTYETIRLKPVSDAVYVTQSCQVSGGKTKLSLYWCAEDGAPVGEGKTLSLGTLTLDSNAGLPGKANLTLLDWSMNRFFSGEVTVQESTAGSPPEYVPSDPVKPDPTENPKPDPIADPEPLPFEDVSPDDWFYSAVQYVYQRGMLKGTSATEFSPGSIVTRGMIVTILHRLEGEPGAAAAGFSDVAADQWYADAVNWAAANGIVNGYSSEKFGPNDTVTREQLATILYRYVGTKGINRSVAGDLSAFADQTAISSYAVDAGKWAVGSGLINGVENGVLSPRGSATRAQAATILMRLCENVLAEAEGMPD